MLPKGCFCFWKEKDFVYNYDDDDDDGDDDDVNDDSDDGDGDGDDDVSVQDNLRVEEGRQSIMAWYQWSQSEAQWDLLRFSFKRSSRWWRLGF